MSQTAKLKNWLPPALVPKIRKWSGRSIRFMGTPMNWAEAEHQSAGYAEGSILERVAATTRLVLEGKAAYERDGVAFDTPDYQYPLLAMLLHAAVANQGHLDVVDFGGSLGSTYRQYRPFFTGLKSLNWQVIEQPGFVSLGRAEFESEELTFHSSGEALPPTTGRRRVLLLSSVLQYLENPDEILRLSELNKSAYSHLIVDRTPVSNLVVDRLCIQEVPAHIYRANYPCRIFSKSKLLNQLRPEWTLLTEFACLDGSWSTDDGLAFEFRGFCFIAKDAA